jgi:hypothetical protein
MLSLGMWRSVWRIETLGRPAYGPATVLLGSAIGCSMSSGIDRRPAVAGFCGLHFPIVNYLSASSANDYATGEYSLEQVQRALSVAPPLRHLRLFRGPALCVYQHPGFDSRNVPTPESTKTCGLAFQRHVCDTKRSPCMNVDNNPCA